MMSSTTNDVTESRVTTLGSAEVAPGQVFHAHGAGVYSVATTIRPGPGFVMPLRSTILETGAGLVVISPIAFDEAMVREIDGRGKVAILVAPNCLHHLFAARARETWPNARLYVAPGLEKKRPDLRSDAMLGAAEAALPPEIASVFVAGAPAINETVFLHRPSRTLIVTDLVFNITEPTGFLTAIILRLVGAWKRLAQSRVWRVATKDRRAAAGAAEELLALDFERLVVAHGEPVLRDAKEKLRAALAAMLRG